MGTPAARRRVAEETLRFALALGRYRPAPCGPSRSCPIKSFLHAKQRLRHELSAADRRALVDAMFADVLVALRRVPALEQIVVVSGDRVAQRIGAGYGATIVEDDERGHNSAATKGIEAALEDGIERVLLVPGDCPLLDPKEVEEAALTPGGRRALRADRARPAWHRHERAAARAAGCARAELRPGQPPSPRGRCGGGRRGCGGGRGVEPGVRRRHARRPRGAAATPDRDPRRRRSILAACSTS